MKKFLPLILVLVALLMFSACSDHEKAEVVIGKSDLFTEEEIQAAVDLVLKDGFSKDAGATITKIWYEEESSRRAVEIYMENGMGSVNGVLEENVMILFSDFKTGSKTQSLNPNDKYTGWRWILIRDSQDGSWKIDDCGY
ncbi:MAG: DUF4829 domain-containing protein [Oscillospiraceae bacterium]|nr:DUF4829 domain-containing protein [Oscillospiraceae bacterium]